jgi:hypothetical protein
VVPTLEIAAPLTLPLGRRKPRLNWTQRHTHAAALGPWRPDLAYLGAYFLSLNVMRRFGKPVLFVPIATPVSSPRAPLKAPMPPTTATTPVGRLTGPSTTSVPPKSNW